MMDPEAWKIGFKRPYATRSRPFFVLVVITIVIVVLTISSIFSRPIKSHLHDLVSSTNDAGGPTWFILVSSSAHLRQRRDIIRSTWQTYYRNVTFDARFVMGTPPDPWKEVVRRENDTFGDIIVLDSAEDDRFWAVTEKPFETFILLKNQSEATGKKYDFVSKIDDDSFLDARTFYRDFLLPNWHVPRLILGRIIQYHRLHTFPAGMFYTLSWDLTMLIADLYRSDERDLIAVMSEEDPPKPEGWHKEEGVLKKRHEDYMISDLLVHAGEEFDYVRLGYDRSFNFDTANLTTGVVNVHDMKLDEQYLWVASMYDESGFAGKMREDGVDMQEKLMAVGKKDG